MIITTTRHGRTARDTRNLISHLGKQVDQVSRVVAVGNVPLSNADQAVQYMEAMRDGSQASVAYHHITISPAERLNDIQRDQTVQRIVSAMGAENHPFVLWEHSEKARNGADVDQHFHLILGHVGPDLKALDDSHSFAKLEAVARSLEVDFEHALTPSRRTASVKSRLVEMGREDVAQHLQIPAELPRSSMTTGQRAKAVRSGLDLPQIQNEIREAWSQSDSPSAFKSALEAGGFSVTPGEKKNVYIVRQGDLEIGALDRIVKEKRAAVAQRMEIVNDRKNEAEIEAITSSLDLRRDANSQNRSAEAAPIARTVERDPERPSQPDRRDKEPVRSSASKSASLVDRDRRSQSESHGNRIRDAIAQRSLRRVETRELKSLADELRDLSRPRVERLKGALEARLDRAKEILCSKFKAPSEPPALVSARDRLDELKRASSSHFYSTTSVVRSAEQVLSEPEPTGFLNRIIGRHRQWRERQSQATEVLSSIKREQSKLGRQVDEFKPSVDRLERQHKSETDVALRKHLRDQENAKNEIELMSAAGAYLRENPYFAGSLEDLLRIAQEKIERERKRSDDEEYQRSAGLGYQR